MKSALDDGKVILMEKNKYQPLHLNLTTQQLSFSANVSNLLPFNTSHSTTLLQAGA